MDEIDDRLNLYCERCKHDGLSSHSTAWCVDCRQHFCSECLLENKVKKQKHHFLSTMKYRDFLLNSYFGGFENCYVHNEIKSKYYCMKHQTACCEKCRRQIHPACGSNVIKMAEEAMNMRTSVAFPDLSERLKDAILSFETLIDDNFEKRNQLELMRSKIINEFIEIREKIDAQMERIQSELIEQLDISYEQHMGNLENIVAYMEEIKEEVNQLKVDTDFVANKLPDLELFFFVKAAEKHQQITDKAIRELKKTNIDIKFRHEIDIGMKDLNQYLKQLSKLHIRGDNISNHILEERRLEHERLKAKSASTEDLSLPLLVGRDTPSTALSLHSPRDNMSTSRFTQRSTSRTNYLPNSTFRDHQNDNVSMSQMSFRSTSRASRSVSKSVGDLGRISELSFKTQASPREYESYIDKLRSGRLSKIRESDKFVEDDNSGIYSNIKNEIFQMVIKFDVPKRNKPSFVTDVRCVSKGRFVLTDYNNKCLMLYDLHGTLTKESLLSDHPQCIAIMNGNEMAVTISGSKIILVVDINSLQTLRHVTAPYECEGITYTENKIIVNCNHEGIFILSKTGKILSKFPKLTGAMYLSMNIDHKLICSMGVAGTVLAISLEGRESFRLKNSHLKRPSGVTWDQFGNLYVATWSNNSIMQIKDNGKVQHCIITSEDNIASPWGIDYDRATDFLVVSTNNGESIAIFKRKSHV